jgi:hypothetical protein
MTKDDFAVISFLAGTLFARQAHNDYLNTPSKTSADALPLTPPFPLLGLFIGPLSPAAER